MKFIAVIGNLLLVSLIAINVEAITLIEKSVITTKLFTVAIDCIQTNPLTYAEIKSFNNRTVPEGKNPKCFVDCVYKKIGFIDDMGMLSPTGARKTAEHVFKGKEDQLDKVEELVESCTEVNEKVNDGDDSSCDRAKLAFTCLIENGPIYGFDFDM